MLVDIFFGIMLPFLGTSLGALCVLFIKSPLKFYVQSILNGFAAGVMMAASVWSLLIPSINKSEAWGAFSFLPALTGFFIGIIFLAFCDRFFLSKKIYNYSKFIGIKSDITKTAMLVFAVAIHNFPEGMAVGAVYSTILLGEDVSLGAAFVLSLGIAVQNIPEGAIVSMPLAACGMNKNRAISVGVLSGIVEPLGALLTIAFSFLFVPILPLFLSFAAGTMVYVVVKQLIPETMSENNCVGVFMFALGFSVMMCLDVALG